MCLWLQFLPQDKVVMFARLTPTELLKETEKAIGSGELFELHKELTERRIAQMDTSHVRNCLIGAPASTYSVLAFLFLSMTGPARCQDPKTQESEESQVAACGCPDILACPRGRSQRQCRWRSWHDTRQLMLRLRLLFLS